MNRMPLDAGLHVHRPPAPLEAFVSQVWFGIDNQDSIYDIVPDGCVDVVMHVTDCETRVWAYGTSTQLRGEPIGPGHYLGIRCRPGTARHFLDVPAPVLTDRKEAVHGEFVLHAASLADAIHD